MKINFAKLNQPLPYSVTKLSITNVTLDSCCLLPALFAGISRRRQGCILGTDTALTAVTIFQATRNAFVLIAVFWGREILLPWFYRSLCTGSLIGQRAETGCVLISALLKMKDFNVWPIFGGICGTSFWLCSSLLRPWDKGTCARKQKADFRRTLLTRAGNEFGVGCLHFVFLFLSLCWWCFNVFIFLFCL